MPASFILIYPYYNNPGMLRMQVENWSRVKGVLSSMVEVIIVDDHSDTPAAPIMQDCKMRHRVYRLSERIPWNMHQCRNIGAFEAPSGADENPWLFLSDIDIMITPEMMLTMIENEPKPEHSYTVERVLAPEFTARKKHANTLLVKHSVFWLVNGYDLDLTPVGGGGYGGDNQFVKQVAALAPIQHMDNVVTVGYGRSRRDGAPAIPDADTQGLDRNEWHAKYVAALARKKAAGDLRSRDPIRTPYERVL